MPRPFTPSTVIINTPLANGRVPPPHVTATPRHRGACTRVQGAAHLQLERRPHAVAHHIRHPRGYKLEQRLARPGRRPAVHLHPRNHRVVRRRDVDGLVDEVLEVRRDRALGLARKLCQVHAADVGAGAHKVPCEAVAQHRELRVGHVVARGGRCGVARHGAGVALELGQQRDERAAGSRRALPPAGPVQRTDAALRVDCDVRHAEEDVALLAPRDRRVRESGTQTCTP